MNLEQLKKGQDLVERAKRLNSALVDLKKLSEQELWGLNISRFKDGSGSRVSLDGLESLNKQIVLMLREEILKELDRTNKEFEEL